MKNLFEKISASFAGAVVFLVGCAMAGLGFTVMAFLAMFALAALGLALLVKPFVDLSERTFEEAEADMVGEKASAA